MSGTVEATNSFKFDTTRVIVRFDGNFVTIIRHRGPLRSSVESRIPVSRITMVNYRSGRAAGGLVQASGFIEFVAAGVDGKVTFPNFKAAGFAAFRDAVEAALH